MSKNLNIYRYLCVVLFIMSSLSAFDKNFSSDLRDINDQSLREHTNQVYRITFLINERKKLFQFFAQEDISQNIRNTVDIFIQKLRDQREKFQTQSNIQSDGICSDSIDHSSDEIVVDNGNLLVTRAISQEEQRKNRKHTFFEISAILVWLGAPTATSAAATSAVVTGAFTATGTPAAVTGFWAFMASLGIGTGTTISLPAAPVIVAVSGGIWGVRKLIKNRKKCSNQNEKKIKNNNNGFGNKKPNGNKDPEKIAPVLPLNNKDKKEAPVYANSYDKKKYEPVDNSHRVYEPNPKHHPNAHSYIGKPPENGYRGVREALPVKGKDFLVGVENGKIVQYNQHAPETYHGYIVEDFFSLDAAAQDALVEAGLFRRTGKIVRK